LAFGEASGFGQGLPAPTARPQTMADSAADKIHHKVGGIAFFRLNR
jgi:hypothetical protein